MTSTTIHPTARPVASQLNMVNAVRSEWIRIWRPTFRYGAIGTPAVFAATISYFIYSSLSDAGSAETRRPGATTAADIEQPGGMIYALGPISTITGVILLSLWALAAASDYDTGMIRVLVQAQPSRLKLLTAKLAALAGFTVIACTVTVLATAIVARPLARSYDVATAAWRIDAPIELLSGAFNFFVPTLVWGLIGLTIAVLTRSAGVAIGLGIGWLLVVENLIAITAPDLTDYLPGGTLSALAGGGSPDLDWLLALGLTVLYGISQLGPRATKSVVYAPTHVKELPVTPPPSAVSATCAVAGSGRTTVLKMLLLVPVIDEFRIFGDDSSSLYTPKLAEAVTLFIDGDDSSLLYTP